MHLLALTKRSAFYIGEKRHIEERHISPVHLIVLHLPATEVTTKSQKPAEGMEVTNRFSLQPIRDEDIDTSERWTNWQRYEILSKGDDNQMYDVITSVTLLRFGISCKFSMQA